MKGKLIVVEGVDGVGKNTQSKLLVKALEAYKEVKFFSFPRYDTPTGMEVADYLNGKSHELTRIEVARLYANDRLAAKKEIEEALEKGMYVVCDRYVLSNIAYQSSWYLSRNGNPDKDKWTEYSKGIISAIEHLEYVVNALPIPDMTLRLILPVDVAMERVTGKDKRSYTEAVRDIHEADVRLMLQTTDFYSNFQDKTYSGSTQIVNCWDSLNGKQYSQERIHEIIWDICTSHYLA